MAKAGDYVKVDCGDQTYTGTLMPRPDILDEHFTVLKLDNGYNIGIEKKRIKKISVLKKHSAKKTSKKKLTVKKGLPNVTILSTGGTISSKVDYRTGGASADYTAEDFVAMCPELGSIANLKTEKVMATMGEDMCYTDWQKMAKAVVKAFKNGADGVVITHGTDTLHYTSAALSFFLGNLDKPVVVTGAQRSIDRGSSDAFMNLVCSVHAAAKSKIPSVMTCMHGTSNDDYCLLVRGTNVRKMHTSRRDAFRPMHEKPLGKVWKNGKIEVMQKLPPPKGKLTLHDKFEPHMGFVYVHPNMNPGIIGFHMKHDVRGIVLAATALGHVPTTHKEFGMLPELELARRKGIPIIVCTQTLYGRTHPYVYTNLRKLSLELDCIFVEDMLPEVAYVKLGWVLGHLKNKEDVKTLKEEMLINHAGEYSERSNAHTFLD